MDDLKRFRDVLLLLSRKGSVVGPGFEPSEELLLMLREHIRVLCVGAGGLGCELLKDLALTGFRHIDVIDMDTIDISNLNRQFLFRMGDVGLSKAEVAAKRVMDRVEGVVVTPHYGRIEEKPREFYAGFHLIILGLDSLEARRYMNQVACSFLEYDDDGELAMSTIKPIIDGGTEGLKGHTRVILPGFTACFECTMWLFPPQTKFPLCTLAETPRTAVHCIEYAHLLLWDTKRSDDVFDADNEEHMRWVFAHAQARADQFGIQGVTYQLTQGVVKNIIPAIASTNAIVSAACVLEALKTVTMVSTGLETFQMYNGSAGAYTHTMKPDRDPHCPVCSPGLPLIIAPSTLLSEVIEQMKADERIGAVVKAPTSIVAGQHILYAKGVFADDTAGNLSRPIGDLLEHFEAGPVQLHVNDPGIQYTLRIQLSFSKAMATQ